MGFPLLGGLGGWLVKLLAGWIKDLGWVPLPGRFRIAVELATAEPYATVGSVVVGVAVGGIVALIAIGEDLRVSIDNDGIHLRRGDDEQHIDRAEVSAVFLEDGALVILGSRSEELARETCDHGKKLADALTDHGFPWVPSDPHAEDYRRWVPDLPGLPDGADALLRAREQALKEDDVDDARQLRDELADLGVVVRDDGTRQFWRRIGD